MTYKHDLSSSLADWDTPLPKDIKKQDTYGLYLYKL